MRSTIAVLAFAAALASRAEAKTFDVHFVIPCWAQSLCPDADAEAALEAQSLLDLEMTNLMWQPVGILFRPAGFEQIVAADIIKLTAYSPKTDPGMVHAMQIAAAHPERITFFLNEEPICWGMPPENVPAGDPAIRELFCEPGTNPSAWAHELGHFFCLQHTFTTQDPATDANPNYDGDGIADTPPDPGRFEAGGGGISGNEPDNGPGHDFCKTEVVYPATAEDEQVIDETYVSWNTPPLLPGLAATYSCSIGCFENDSNGDPQPTDLAPLAEDGMSYYNGCNGPYVLNGVRHEFFTAGQAQAINSCIDNFPERNALVDVCAGIGDSDHDGLCDDEDPCPNRPGLRGLDLDSDGDGIVDACDPCPTVAGPAVDTDGDGICDAVDADDDNDGCRDSEDKHPLDSMILVGHVHVIGNCDKDHDLVAFEGAAYPGKTLPMCNKADDDIDGDGIKDVDDPCPATPGVLCTTIEICPLVPKWKPICELGSCNELFLKIVEVVDPERAQIVDHFQIANDTIYALPNVGKSLLETARLFEPTRDSAVRVEIWSREGHVADVATYDAATFSRGAFAHGKTIALTPIYAAHTQQSVDTAHSASVNSASSPLDREGTEPAAVGMRLDVTWGVGLSPDELLPDADGDGVPDMFDNCTQRANVDQHDADADGYGDVCDADIDNDGVVGASDVLAILRAIGTTANREHIAVASPRRVVGNPVAADGYQTTMGDRLGHFYRAAADLNDDGNVDVTDVLLAVRSLGAAPGPSGLRDSPATDPRR